MITIKRDGDRNRFIVRMNSWLIGTFYINPISPNNFFIHVTDHFCDDPVTLCKDKIYFRLDFDVQNNEIALNLNKSTVTVDNYINKEDSNYSNDKIYSFADQLLREVKTFISSKQFQCLALEVKFKSLQYELEGDKKHLDLAKEIYNKWQLNYSQTESKLKDIQEQLRNYQ